MADLETIHYGTLVRLQVAMSALQSLLAATAEENAEEEGQAERIALARHDAVAAIHIALGGQHDVPERLTRNWRDLNMVRNATRALKDSA